MAFLVGFGKALPERVVANAELAPKLGVEPEWMLSQTGIEERRYAADSDTVPSLGTDAAFNCLERAGSGPDELGLVLVASGSTDRFCPGPASAIAAELGLSSTPAIDLPVGSAGGLIGLVFASRLAATFGNVLVVASEIMSRRVELTPAGKNTAVLFGDGAGAALISPRQGFARVADTCLHTDGNSAAALTIENGRIAMEGGLIIRQATRRMPEAIEELLDRNALTAGEIGGFVLHQANGNLLSRIAKTVGVPSARFFANIARYGNTSSASLLIAAAEWHDANPGPLSAPLVFSAFGTGLNWGALLALPHEG